MEMRGKIIIDSRLFRFAVAFLLLVSASSIPLTAKAAAVTNFSDTLSTIEQSVTANHTITFTTADDWSSTETLSIDFPDTFTTTGFANNEPEDYDLTDDGAEQVLVANGGCSGTALEIEITTVNTSTNTFTFTRCTGDATIASGSVVIIEIGTNATTGSAGNDQITSQTAAQNNSDALVTLAGNFGGSGQLALEIVADNTTLVNATVDASITCAFTGLTTTFSSLNTGAVSTSDTSTTVTVSTNAGNGFNLTVRDAGNTTNPGLYKSSGTTYLIGSADSSYGNTATLSNGVDGFGIQGSTSGGSGGAVTIAARYDQTSNAVGGLELTDTTLASATAAVANRVVTVVHKAAVSGLAPAGSYTDVLTYVCTGIF